jgi:2-polyprenyl-3-methyl-5-hydroxy-6-metoxy-1,4-benzoquinol methylase
MSSNKEIKNFYENFTKNLIKDKIYPNCRHQKIKKYLKEVLNNKKIESVLEVGCGIGIISEFISKKVSEVVGIDISEENIKFAKATVKHVKFYCTDFFEFSSKKSFELITLFDVLEHFPKEKHKNVFQKISELSSPNTIILITIPDPNYIAYVRKNAPEKLQVVDEEIHFEELKTIFDQFNFDIIKYERYGIDTADQYRFYSLGYLKTDKIYNKPNKIHQLLIKRVYNKIMSIIKKIKYAKYLKN